MGAQDKFFGLMKIWAISDLHFSYSGRYDMRKFGSIWNNTKDALKTNWRRKISAEDIVLMPGDLSWEYELETALHDIREFARLPGRRKFIIRGNHDIWWKDDAQVSQSAPQSVWVLSDEGHVIGDILLAGSMGWLSPNDPCSDALDSRRFDSELKTAEKRLQHASEIAEGKKKIVYLIHFPPFTTNGEPTAFSRLLEKYSVSACVCGHFHAPAEWKAFPHGLHNGVNYQLVSTDFLKHNPVEVLLPELNQD